MRHGSLHDRSTRAGRTPQPYVQSQWNHHHYLMCLNGALYLWTGTGEKSPDPEADSWKSWATHPALIMSATTKYSKRADVRGQVPDITNL
jgi:hypothetical protein